MSFPDSIRDIEVEFLIDGEWIRAEGDGGVLVRDGMNIKRGYSDWNLRLQAGSCSFTLKNNDLRYSVDNPLSAYYGFFGQNTPCRVKVIPEYGLYVPGHLTYASTPDSAALSPTGDLDMRCEVDYSPRSANRVYLCSKWATSGNQRSWLFYIDGNNTLVLKWSNNGTTEMTATSTAAVTPGRLAVRATIDVDNGAAGRTITFYTAPSIAGPWTQLGSAVTTAGTTSIFNSITSVTVSDPTTTGILDQNTATYIAMELRSGIGGSVIASPDFAAQTPHDTSFADAQANVWTVTEATAYSGIGGGPPRFYGEVSSVEDASNLPGTDKFVLVEVKTGYHRMSRGESKAGTTLETWVPAQTGAAFKAEGYWPLNEGPGSNVGRPLVSTYPLVLQQSDSPNARFGRGDLKLPWIEQCVELYAGDQLGAQVEMGSSVNNWEFSFLYACQDGANMTVNIYSTWLESIGGGAFRVHKLSWDILLLPTTRQIGITKPDGTQTLVSVDTWSFDPFDGVGKTVMARFEESGGQTSVDITLSSNYEGQGVKGTNDIIDNGMSTTVIGWEPGRITAFDFQHSGAIDKPFKLAHVAVFSTDDLGSGLYYMELPAAGRINEQADARMERLCDEKGVNFTASRTVSVATTALMGAQLPESFLKALTECADADMGILTEPRSDAGFHYAQLSYLQDHDNGPSVTLDYSQLSPTFRFLRDDQMVVNDMTVKRSRGGEGRYQQTTGRYAVTDPLNGGVGVFDSSATLNLARDGQTIDAAGWIVHKGTVDEPRMPTVTVNLASRPIVEAGLHYLLLNVDVGSRIDITGLQSRGIYDTVKLMVIGYTERLNSKEHILTFVCVPYSPYEVAYLTETSGVKLNSGTSTTNGAFTSGTSTSLSVAISNPADLWSTSASHYPLHIKVAGVVLNATACSGASSPQTMTVDATPVNGVVKAIPIGSKVSLERPTTLAYITD